jgi:muramidase (phage lysozyme)
MQNLSETDGYVAPDKVQYSSPLRSEEDSARSGVRLGGSSPTPSLADPIPQEGDGGVPEGETAKSQDVGEAPKEAVDETTTGSVGGTNPKDIDSPQPQASVDGINTEFGVDDSQFEDTSVLDDATNYEDAKAYLANGPVDESAWKMRETISLEDGTQYTSVFYEDKSVKSTQTSEFANSNPEIKGILDTIAHAEGTDKGDGYNETLAYGAFTGGDVNLTNMTVNEVRDLQRSMLKHPKNTWGSSAVGRYQIVGTTLKGLSRKMGLKGDEKFTPELQDRMAVELLKGRGYDKFKAGKISKENFMSGLANEWASLPKASGQTAYANQPRSGVSVSQLSAALGG